MIPHKIHYCWFGRSPKPKLAERCIASWKKYCPDYEIIEWNEDNFDVNANGYTRMCYEQKKYAFLSDYVRLAVVAEHGGVYFDTDVELIKTIDGLMRYEAFFGFENSEVINTGEGFGATAGHLSVKAMLEKYNELKVDENGNYPLVSCPNLNTLAIEPFGFVRNGERQNIVGADIFPVEYFNPYDNATGQLNITENTYSVHWYSKSWMSGAVILRSRITRPFHRIFGKDCFSKWKKVEK